MVGYDDGVGTITTDVVDVSEYRAAISTATVVRVQYTSNFVYVALGVTFTCVELAPVTLVKFSLLVDVDGDVDVAVTSLLL